MKCPNCGLINPQSTMRCDCGYEFVSGKAANTSDMLRNTRKIQESQLSTLSNIRMVLWVIAVELLAIMLLIPVAFTFVTE